MFFNLKYQTYLYVSNIPQFLNSLLLFQTISCPEFECDIFVDDDIVM